MSLHSDNQQVSQVLTVLVSLAWIIWALSVSAAAMMGISCSSARRTDSAEQSCDDNARCSNQLAERTAKIFSWTVPPAATKQEVMTD
jgi:hypothetical protein